MNKDEIKKALECCKNQCCSYCPHWCEKGCQYQTLSNALDLITEQENEIEQLKAENEQLEEDIDMIIKEQKDDCKFDIKQAQIDVLNKAKEKLNSAPNGWAYTGYIDDLIEEVQNV